MNRLPPNQTLQIVQIYFENRGSVREIYHALRSFYSRHNRPSKQLIRIIMDRFSTHTLIDNVHPQRRTVRTEKVVTAVERSVQKEPNESICHPAQQLELCPSTLWNILRKDLYLQAYKIQLMQELKPRDHYVRRMFDEWAKNKIVLNPHFHQTILFSDEAHFWLNAYVNKQNCRIWSEENPEAFIETPYNPQKSQCWVCFMSWWNHWTIFLQKQCWPERYSQ